MHSQDYATKEDAHTHYIKLRYKNRQPTGHKGEDITDYMTGEKFYARCLNENDDGTTKYYSAIYMKKEY